MILKLDKTETEELKKLPPLGVCRDLELKGVWQKRRTWWAQVYDRTDDKFYHLLINKENNIKHKGERLNMSDFK